jgi:integrase
MLYTQLNSDIFVGTINVPLPFAIAEYLKKYDTLGLSSAAKTEAKMSLRQLTSNIPASMGTKSLTQRHIDRIISTRKEAVSIWTVNKDIANIKAFIGWSRHRSRRYFSPEIEMTKLKTPQIVVTALTDDQIAGLIKRAPTKAWRIRLLISLTTGLRKTDVDSLAKTDIDLDNMIITVVAKKTGKITQCPVADAIADELAAYLAAIDGDRVFTDVNLKKTWDGFRRRITRQDLRKTFSTLTQRSSGLAAAKEMLGHADARTTDQFYTDRLMVMRWKINSLPIKKWLDK